MTFFPSKKFKYLKMVIYILKTFQKNLFPVLLKWDSGTKSGL